MFRKRTGELLTKCSTGVVRWTADQTGLTPTPVPRAGNLALR